MLKGSIWYESERGVCETAGCAMRANVACLELRVTVVCHVVTAA